MIHYFFARIILKLFVSALDNYRLIYITTKSLLGSTQIILIKKTPFMYDG